MKDRVSEGTASARRILRLVPLASAIALLALSGCAAVTPCDPRLRNCDNGNSPGRGAGASSAGASSASGNTGASNPGGQGKGDAGGQAPGKGDAGGKAPGKGQGGKGHGHGGKGGKK